MERRLKRHYDAFNTKNKVHPLFGLFSNKPKPPTYLVWQNNAARWQGIWESIPNRTGDGRLLFVVHFDETLAILNELLEQDGLVAHSLERNAEPSDLCDLPPGLYIARASQLRPQSDGKVASANSPLKIIAIEPHLMPEPDPHLRTTLDQIRGNVLYEHHASLDDLTVRLFAGQRTLELLSKAGFNDGDCLKSGMVSRAIVRAQTKLAMIEGIDPTIQSLEGWQAKLPAIEQG